MDTIYAMATARGRAGVSVLRLSGPRAHDALRALAGSLPPFRHSRLATLRDEGGEVLDRALVLAFAAGSSFTGEDVVEFHLHGSPAVGDAVSRALSRQSGLRPAQPGEFTRRALENGRMDLTEVEGLSDLIAAETEAQRRQALRLMGGDLGRKAGSWRTRLVRAEALLTALIDFADEEVPDTVTQEALALIDAVRRELEVELAGARMAERVRSGFEVAIVGPPNVGKSTLLNRLARREAALTSEIPGTTRDVIEVRMDLDGLPVTFLDTAGLRSTEDRVEAMGVDRALSRAKAADLRVALIEEALPEIGPVEISLRPKADLDGDGSASISGLTGAGVETLLDRIAGLLAERAGAASSAVNERHRLAMSEAVSHLSAASDVLASGAAELELAAEEIGSATRRLDALIGRVDVEDILDDVFATFCLGK